MADRLSPAVKGSVKFLLLRRRAHGFTRRQTVEKASKLVASQLRRRGLVFTSMDRITVDGQRLRVSWDRCVLRNSIHWRPWLRCDCGRRCRYLCRSARDRWECARCCGMTVECRTVRNEKRWRLRALKHLRKLSPYRDADELVKPGDVRRPPALRKRGFAAWLSAYWLLWCKACAFDKPWKRRVFAQRPRRVGPASDPELLQAYRRRVLGRD
jgi:hypothetical protein